ncbi:hypothetical protein SAMN02745135_02002 [Caloranaerobacter azorensis DSM 13643]|uniref:DUF2313 domain-containing protein n=1 Tax=Caloranaerobacter azorensis DSM 13643 TaxID=1121264 RepID=A0A1M5VLS9_9FIRM|nr:putative phage tail protein [Caloranaerobacter azorensis]SHH76191.1 hypothetical protein SAMN02745135_02002 [Caloranaerobacter azorensis DSM 13643]
MNLMNLLPPYYNGNLTMEELQSIIGTEIKKVSEGLNKTISECFINTASDLLSRYEKIHGLTVDVSKPYEFRRERIKAKIRGTGTVTKQIIKEVASSYSNGEVEVIEDNENYRFIIKFVSTIGIPRNIADLKLTIEEIKPAHLTYTFEFTYRTHGELKNYTHEALSNYTHQTLREGVI